MAGYLFGLDSDAALAACLATGVFATKFKKGGPTQNKWKAHHEGTLADYSSMRPGDNVYFFIDRKIYGIGRLIEVGGHCRYANFPNAGKRVIKKYSDISAELLMDFGPGSQNQPFLCLFAPDPVFFVDGIDMDEVLLSDPGKFKILRVFWKLSFIKFDDNENQAFRNILLQRNASALQNSAGAKTYTSNYLAEHQRIESNLATANYELDITPVLSSAAKSNGSIGHEMALEAGLIFQLSEKERQAVDVFGEWDYISHQVPASPFKPVDYMDKMDVFGYRFIPNIPNHPPTISKFLVVELKRGGKKAVNKQDLLQLMKYIDWVKNEYASGDYSMIKAFLLGFNFTADCVASLNELAERNFIHGFRPSTPMKWSDVTLVRYLYDPKRGKLDFSIVASAHPSGVSPPDPDDFSLQ